MLHNSEPEPQKAETAPEPQADTPPVLTPPRKKNPVTLAKPLAANGHNYRIADDHIGEGTPLERFQNNLNAIRLLKVIESEERTATPEEQSVLAQYVGWGGLADFFDEKNPRCGELKNLLTDEEYTAARGSTLTAFYTPPVVIRGIYQALAQMGFTQGNILEPACGIGNFLGMLPENMADSKLYGVELDDLSGRMARQLYQKSGIAVQGYEKTAFSDNFFDVAIGNVPFGQFKVPDKRYDRLNLPIHEYFIAKTLDKVRPGGVIAFVTSSFTMDKRTSNVRKYIAQRADLLGAIRLPNNAFKAAAGTEVVSDILFLQKRERMVDIEPEWVHLATDSNGIQMNSYFIDYPDMVLGEMKMVSGPYGQTPTCEPYADQKLLEPKLEIKTEDGYEGILSLDHTTIQVEAAGYSTSKRTVSAQRTYPNLSDADVSLIPKTVEENGRALTLADVNWQEAATDPTDGYDLPIRYTAVASYTGTATSKYATGYTVTADYKGDVTRVSCDTVIYTAVFSGTDKAATNESGEQSNFNWLWLLLPAGALALGGCGYAGYKGFKHYQNKKRGYE